MLRKLIYSLLLTSLVTFLFFSLTSHFAIQLPISHFSLPNLLLTSHLNIQPFTYIFPLPTYKSSVLSESVKNPKTKEVEVAARVGGYILEKLTGWTSPYAEVTLTSEGLSRKTIADSSGFFAFYFIPVPKDLGELCLISQDVNQLPSYPNCLAPPPKNMSLEINDILLSPTISLQGAEIPTGRTAKASGMTFPDSEVEVYFFSENSFFLSAVIADFSPRFFQFVRKLKFATATENVIADFNLRPFVRKLKFATTFVKIAYAVGLPGYKVKSNQNGYFEFSLPATSPANNRVFAVSRFSNLSNLSILGEGGSGGLSPKSNTLAFRSIGLLGIFLAFLKDFFRQAGIFFGSLKNNPFRVILIEIGILISSISAILLKKFRGKLKD